MTDQIEQAREAVEKAIAVSRSVSSSGNQSTEARNRTAVNGVTLPEALAELEPYLAAYRDALAAVGRLSRTKDGAIVLEGDEVYHWTQAEPGHVGPLNDHRGSQLGYFGSAFRFPVRECLSARAYALAAEGKGQHCPCSVGHHPHDLCPGVPFETPFGKEPTDGQ